MALKPEFIRTFSAEHRHLTGIGPCPESCTCLLCEAERRELRTAEYHPSNWATWTCAVRDGDGGNRDGTVTGTPEFHALTVPEVVGQLIRTRAADSTQPLTTITISDGFEEVEPGRFAVGMDQLVGALALA